MILGLDFGRPSGVGVIRWNGHLVERRTLMLDGTQERNVYDLYKELNGLLNRLEISLVTFEEVNFIPEQSGTAALQMQARYKAIVMLLCQAYQIPFARVYPSQIKKRATGKGSWSKGTKAKNYKDKKNSAEVKEMVKRQAARQWSLRAVQEDAAMALWCAEFARTRLGTKKRARPTKGLEVSLETDLFNTGA